ncbi:MAG: hypothetical protein M0Z94_13650 [Dehalococcoidales bacterium]|nr:hypothetical protein [Dehalococcoidales bacterium]
MATLSAVDAALFIRLHVVLLVYVNRKLGLVPGVDSEEAFRASSLEDKLKIRDALYADPQVIDSFIAENPARIPPDELALVATWKQAVAGKFYIFRYLKRYTVFLNDKEPPKAYGVLGITDEIEHMFRQDPPIMVTTVLLPWRDKIIYDGLVQSYNVYFGAGIRGSLNQTYQKIKATTGIIETLSGPAGGQQVPRRSKKHGPSVEELLAALDRIEQETAGLKMPETPAQRSALGVLRAAVDLARAAVHERANVDEVVRAGRRLNSALNRLYTALDLR